MKPFSLEYYGTVDNSVKQSDEWGYVNTCVYVCEGVWEKVCGKELSACVQDYLINYECLLQKLLWLNDHHNIFLKFGFEGTWFCANLCQGQYMVVNILYGGN